MCACLYHGTCLEVRRKPVGADSLLSSTLRILRIKLRLQGLVANTLTLGANFLAQHLLSILRAEAVLGPVEAEVNKI